MIIVGDILFAGSVGRTDLPGGNHNQLITGIKEKLLTLDDDVKIYSGHGDETTIGWRRGLSFPAVNLNGLNSLNDGK